MVDRSRRRTRKKRNCFLRISLSKSKPNIYIKCSGQRQLLNYEYANIPITISVNATINRERWRNFERMELKGFRFHFSSFRSFHIAIKTEQVAANSRHQCSIASRYDDLRDGNRDREEFCAKKIFPTSSSSHSFPASHLGLPNTMNIRDRCTITITRSLKLKRENPNLRKLKPNKPLELNQHNTTQSNSIVRCQIVLAEATQPKRTLENVSRTLLHSINIVEVVVFFALDVSISTLPSIHISPPPPLLHP